MCNYQEDEPPCIHHRSAFDTIPAPPPSRAGWTSIPPPSFGVQPDGAYVTRINAPVREPEFAAPAYIRKPSEPTLLSFRGGEVELLMPTRADLVLSAQQWATAVREELKDQFGSDGSTWKRVAVVMRKVDRLDAILKELAES